MPTDADSSNAESLGQGGRADKLAREAELLAKVRDVSRQIVERVNKVLGDTGAHASLPAEEKKPLE